MLVVNMLVFINLVINSHEKAPAKRSRGYGARGTPFPIACLILGAVYVGKRLDLRQFVVGDFRPVNRLSGHS